MKELELRDSSTGPQPSLGARENAGRTGSETDSLLLSESN